MRRAPSEHSPVSPKPFRDCGADKMEIDLHGYHPNDIDLATLVKQAWETGTPELTLIHGHGRNRGISPGFVNKNTGYFGLRIRSALRHDPKFKEWVKRSTLYCGHEGSTTIKLKPNPNPTRARIDMELVGSQAYGYAR
jgi:hypothetical protein